MPSTPQQLRARARFETLIGLAAPALDLVLVAGERVSRFVAPDDDYVPIRSGRRPRRAGARGGARPGREATGAREQARDPRSGGRGQRLAGISAVAAAPLYIISVALDQSGSVPITGLDTERYRAINDAAGQLLASALLRSLAFFALVIPLLYIFRAAQARSERVNGAMVGFVFIGPILLGVQGIVAWFAQTHVASDFVAQSGPSGDIYTQLQNLIDGSTAFDVASNLLFPALLGLIVVMVYVPLQAQRTGLLTRFFATLGMALGVSSLFIVPALSLLALMIWFGWLGFTILDRVQGRPAAESLHDHAGTILWPR